MKLMPYNPYLQSGTVQAMQQTTGSGIQMPLAAVEETSGSRGKGKRKSTRNPAGESPSKKVAVRHEEDVMEVGDD